MTTINSPAPAHIQPGDVVYFTHPNLFGELGLKAGANSQFSIPGYGSVAATTLGGHGYVAARLERTEVNRDELTLSGKLENGRLTVELVLPSGARRVLIAGQPTAVSGTREVKITKADFEG